MGQHFCWQHAEGWGLKWKCLPALRKRIIVCVSFLGSLASLYALWPHGQTSSRDHIQTSGDNSPVVQDNHGKVTITYSQPQQPKKNIEQGKNQPNPLQARTGKVAHTNSAIQNAGLTQNVSISGVRITAPPNGNATLIQTLPRGTSDHIEIREATISSPLPHTPEQQHGAVLNVEKGHGVDKALIEENMYCDSDSLIQNSGTATNITARKNSTYDCNWANFLGWLTSERNDEKTNERLLQWETRLETTWAGDSLSLEQKERNRKELKRIEARIVGEFLPALRGKLSDGKSAWDVIEDVEKDAPRF